MRVSAVVVCSHPRGRVVRGAGVANVAFRLNSTFVTLPSTGYVYNISNGTSNLYSVSKLASAQLVRGCCAVPLTVLRHVALRRRFHALRVLGDGASQSNPENEAGRDDLHSQLISLELYVAQTHRLDVCTVHVC